MQGKKFKIWKCRSLVIPSTHAEIKDIVLKNRSFQPLQKLDYGDHGLDYAVECILRGINNNKRIALYADYDVDGTMSCVSWIWFLRSIGYTNFVHYIPCRFKEGYGVNLQAIQHLIQTEKAQLIITMDTGITANVEAAYCQEKGVEFICTDHHKVQPEKMPDCILVNPKFHPDPIYQELCGCGITFALLRRLAKKLTVPNELWTDLLALAGMATICDLVPLNPVNHSLVRSGVAALMKSNRKILQQLRATASLHSGLDEKDVGFRLGPRINAVGRLGHADKVIEAFIGETPEILIEHMERCNQERRRLQDQIVKEAREMASSLPDDSILFMGSENWHPGVVGIAANKIAEEFWKPTWLFQKTNGIGKGSCRSIGGFDVTDAMASTGKWRKFGGHRAAGGFTFDLQDEESLRYSMLTYANAKRTQSPEMWETQITYDCTLDADLLDSTLPEHLGDMKPFGPSFEEPKFQVHAEIIGHRFFNDKTTGRPKHTCILIKGKNNSQKKILFFNEVLENLQHIKEGRFIISIERDNYLGQAGMKMTGWDLEL